MAAEEVLGGPMVVALRPALHGALLEATGLDAITFGSEVTGFTADGDRVAVRTASGHAAEGDLLIGADGTGSVIRRALHPSEPPPRPCGIIAVRGASSAAHHLGDLSGVMYLGPGLESVLVRASDRFRRLRPHLDPGHLGIEAAPLDDDISESGTGTASVAGRGGACS